MSFLFQIFDQNGKPVSTGTPNNSSNLTPTTPIESQTRSNMEITPKNNSNSETEVI